MKKRILKVEQRAMHIPPQLRLKGKWLAQVFTPGCKVQVCIEAGKITITPAKEEQTK